MSDDKQANYFLGCKPTSVPGLEYCNVLFRPQVRFKPHYFVVPAVLAMDFLIMDIKVGRESEFISGDPISAVIFSGDVIILKDQIVKAVSDLPLRMHFDVCEPGKEICITVRNMNNAPRNFHGVLVGPPIV